MTLFKISIGISIAVISLVVYSALIISSRGERLAEHIKKENRFERNPYQGYPTGDLAFETSDELAVSDDFNPPDELNEFNENYF